MTEVLRDFIRRNRAGHKVAVPSVWTAQPDVMCPPGAEQVQRLIDAQVSCALALYFFEEAA